MDDLRDSLVVYLMCFARPQVFCQLIARNHLLDTFCQVDQASVLLVCEYLSRSCPSTYTRCVRLSI